MQPKNIFISLLPDEYDDIKAEVCYQNAISAIYQYTNKSNVEELFPYPLAQLSYFFYKGFNDIINQSKSQGSRSNTLIHDIPEEIKAMLPKNRTVRVF